MFLLLSNLCIGLVLFLLIQQFFKRYEERFHLLQKERLAVLQHNLAQEFLFIHPKLLRRILWCGTAIGLLVSIVILSPLPLVIGCLLAWLAPIGFLKRIQRRRRKLFEGQFGLILPQISSILHAGHTFERAIDSLARSQPPPMRDELQLVLKELGLGVAVDQAFEKLLTRFPNRDLKIVIRALAISRRVGSNLAEAFDRVSEMIRSRAALRAKLSALTAQGKMQAWIAMSLPVAIMGVLTFVAPGHLTPLFTTATGKAALVVTALMLAIGGTLIHRIATMELIK